MRYLRSSVLVAASVGLPAVWFVAGMLVSPVAPVLGESIVATPGTAAPRSTTVASAPASKSATSASPTPRQRPSAPSATTATPPRGGAGSVGAKRVRPGDVCVAGVSDLDDDDDDDLDDDDFDDDLCDD